jgi:DNA-binding NarL/FixJ family response regulator
VCRRVRAVSPATAVVMLTSYCQDSIILKSLNAGAKGYLIKDVELGEVKRAIRAASRGHSVLDPKVAARVLANTLNGGTPRAALSDRDLAIIRHVAGGLTNKEIGLLVHLSGHTIKDRLEKIAAAFDVRSRAEIVAEAFRAGLI